MRACLVITPGTGDPAAVAEALRRVEPDLELVAVWAGDPQLRPATPAGARWVDVDLAEPSGLGWHRLIVAMSPSTYALARGTRSLERLFENDPAPTLLLRIGAVSVLDELGDPPTTGVLAADRAPAVLIADGQAPTLADGLAAGRWGSAALWFADDAGDAARSIADALTENLWSDHPGAVMQVALEACGTTVGEFEAAETVGWRPDLAATRHPGGVVGNQLPGILDVESVDRDRPWLYSFDTRPARLRQSNDPLLSAQIAATTDQWAGDLAPLKLPGGVAVDQSIRHLVVEQIERWRRGGGPLPPEPFGNDQSEFVRWLETPWPPWGPDVGRYWNELYSRRPDLIDAFPAPAGADHDAFVAWTRDRWKHDGTSIVLRETGSEIRPPWSDAGREHGGINVVGYLGFDKSLGDVVRRAHRSLQAAGVPTAALHYHRSGSPHSAETPVLTDEVRFHTNLVVINADQFGLLDADYGHVLFADRKTIAYWFWELEYIPPAMIAALEYVDELWVATDYTTKAFQAVTDKPVRTVPIPVPEPQVSNASRSELGMPVDRFVFLVTLDHLSVTERKNPVAAVEAFKMAFPTPTATGPILMVKTLNSEHRWAAHETLRVAADGRADIIVIDQHLSRSDQMALTQAADCLVSLHRAEGLGLHLMEAMWLGVPTIATRYSGNLGFMTDQNSALVDASMVPVSDGENYFPADAVWAEPDLGVAADWMQRMVAEPALRERLAAAAVQTMRGQPSLAETGHLIARLAGVTEPGYDMIGTR